MMTYLYVFSNFVQFGPHNPENRLEVCRSPLKLDGEIINRPNSAADCAVSARFGTEFEHVTPDVLQTFKVKGSKVKVTE